MIPCGDFPIATPVVLTRCVGQERGIWLEGCVRARRLSTSMLEKAAGVIG